MAITKKEAASTPGLSPTRVIQQPEDFLQTLKKARVRPVDPIYTKKRRRREKTQKSTPKSITLNV